MKKGRIISDISKRVLIVEGEEELKRILSIPSREKNDNIVETKRLAENVWEIEIIKRVGSFYNMRWLNEENQRQFNRNNITYWDY